VPLPDSGPDASCHFTLSQQSQEPSHDASRSRPSLLADKTPQVGGDAVIAVGTDAAAGPALLQLLQRG
jgi:hypothetical protein